MHFHIVAWLILFVNGLKALEIGTQNVTAGCHDISPESEAALWPGRPLLVLTRVFRNSYQVRVSAAGRNGYFLPFRDTATSTWMPNFITGIRPNNRLFNADHPFELQMLTMWMNHRNLPSTYFGNDLPELKGVLNGAHNGAYITQDLNCAKRLFTTSAMQNALLHSMCQNAEMSEMVAYMRALNADLRIVVNQVREFIRRKSIPDADDYYTVMTIVPKCLMGGQAL